jgi:PKD repeat protein
MKIFTPFVFALFTCMWCGAQITLTTADMPTVGWSIVYVKDSALNSVNYGSAGASQVYDFSHLTNTRTSTTSYTTPNSTQQSNYPNANLMASSDGQNFAAVRNTGNFYDAEGLQTDLSGHQVFGIFSPVDTLLSFTTQYQGNFSGVWGFTQTVPGSYVNEPGAETITVTYIDYYKDTIDGWGVVKTPLGSYNGLREVRRDSTHTKITAQIFLIGTETVENYSEVTLEYQYLAKETKGPLVKFDYDSAGDLLDAQYAAIPPAPVAYFTSVPGPDGLINFTDSSSNSPTSYAWTFGDGDSSTLINPAHNYALDGTYYVCETVSNTGGSSIYCDSVQVTNAPPPGAFFVSVAELNGTVLFTSEDTGAALTYSWTFGDGDTSNVENPAHQYLTNGTYYVCETVTNVNGSAVYCDSVHVTNAPPPIAFFIAVVELNGTVVFTSEDTGTVITYSWNFGDGDTSDVENPTHRYLANGTYYVCQTVTNVNGSATYCDSVQITGLQGAHYPPVAANDTSGVVKPNQDTLNVTANDYSPSGDSFCIASVSNPVYFTVSGCNDVIFNSANATAPGMDTAWYIVCNVDQPTLCDSAMIIVTVNPCTLPVAQFTRVCPIEIGDSSACWFDTYLYANAAGSDSVIWHVQSINQPAVDTFFVNYDSLRVDWSANCTNCDLGGLNYFTVCLTTFNSCGSSSYCDTLANFAEGINQIQLSGISIYPNPTNNELTIDMRDNTDAITRNYSAIEVYNAIGQKVLDEPRDNQYQLVNISVAGLPEGLYLATILDSQGEQKTLGKFIVLR